MILILAASIMYWSLKKPEENITPEASPKASVDGESETDLVDEVSHLAIDEVSNLAIDETTSENASSS